jgi:hypothetical protein
MNEIKIKEVWLRRGENLDEKLIKPNKGEKLVVYRSGNSDLFSLTEQLLKLNQSVV